jgi:hypothetical protein
VRIILFILFLGSPLLSTQAYGQNSPTTENEIPGQLTSINLLVNRVTDSLNQEFVSQTRLLDSVRHALSTRLDSTHHRMGKSKVVQMIDSIDRLRERTIANLNEKLESLKTKTVEGLKNLNFPSELNEKISTVAKNIEDLKFTSTGIEVDEFASTMKSLRVVNDLDLSSIQSALEIDKIPDLKASVPDMPTAPKELGVYGEDIQQIAQGDSAALAKVASMAEEKAVELSGLSDIQQQTKVFDEHKQQLDHFKNPSSMAEQGVEQLQQAAMDHFAGREQVLQAAMDKMSKYKEKYESLPSLTDVPFKRPNEMRGKPFIERIVPAFMVQIQMDGKDLLLDFNPYVGYRITGKLTAGPGWNQRIAYDTDDNQFTSKPRIYGPRVFGEYDLWKGFHPRVEVEVMNAFVSPLTKPATIDQGSREWVWGVFVGVKKEYRFIKNVKGTVLIMTRLFDPKHKSPYGDIINARFGFEFPMKKKHLKTPKSPSGT